jgi:hypothetical protein
MLGHPFLERLDGALANAVPTMNIAVRGEWTARTRRPNQTEIVDHVWDARLTSAGAFTGMAFLLTESGIYWAKAAHSSQDVSARVSFHAYVEIEPRQKTFAVGLDDVYLPSIPVVANFENPSECLVDTTVVSSGRVACLARCDGKGFFVVLFGSDSIMFGRNRLWRVRDPIASQLPPDIRELLTRRRAGVLRSGPTP